MKRCPECFFIYPESDERCDFDNTPLVIVNDSEIDAATNPETTGAKDSSKKPRSSAKKPRRGKKAIPAAGAVLILLGLLLSLVYYRASKIASADVQASTNIPVIAVPSVLAEAPSPAPLSSPSASPSPTSVETHKPDQQRVATSHSTTSVDPVSTSGPGMGTRRGGKPVILLTSGGKIDADEVWRTRDGVWYRRNGMVTLLKRNRVKAIVNQ